MPTGVRRHRAEHGTIQTKPLPVSLHRRHRHQILENQAACRIWTRLISRGISRFRLLKQLRLLQLPLRRRLQADGALLPVVRITGPAQAETRAGGVLLLHLKQQSHQHRQLQKRRTTIHGVPLPAEPMPVEETQPGAETQMAGGKQVRVEVRMQFRTAGRHPRNSRKAGVTRLETIRIQVPAPPCRQSPLNQNRQQLLRQEVGVRRAAPAAVGGKLLKNRMTAGVHRPADNLAVAGVSLEAAMPGVTNRRKFPHPNQQLQLLHRHRLPLRHQNRTMPGRWTQNKLKPAHGEHSLLGQTH